MSGINGYKGFINDIVRGSARKFRISVSDLNDAPVDLTGYRFYIGFSVDYDPTTAVEFEVQILAPTNPEEGFTTGLITSDNSNLLPVGNVYYELKYTDPDDLQNYTADQGKIEVFETVFVTV